MDNIADALVYAVAYINCRGDEGDDDLLDDDVGALESIAAFLADSTPAEQDVLAAAAERALIAEKSSARPREKFVRDYACWMEEMFGEEWEGNRRIQ
ncbi:MAG: hypothetical protein U0793_07295 [Gemmataceae bacterium]